MKFKYTILIASILILPKCGMAETTRQTYQCPSMDHITSSVNSGTLFFTYRVSLPVFSKAWFTYYNNNPVLFCRYGQGEDSRVMTLNASLPEVASSCEFANHSQTCTTSAVGCVLSCKKIKKD